MREGYYLKSNEKHLYLLDSKRRPIECLTNLIENFNHINIFNGTGEMSFVIYYNDETKHIYNAFIEKMTHLRLEDYGEFIVDTAPENIEGEVRYKTVTCKDEEYMLNKRLLTLVNNSASFFSGVLWTTDTSVPCVMREFFNEVPSWSIGTVDSEIDNTKKSFRDIKKQNMLKFIYENIEQAFDCIPFFDSLNRTISFRKTKNAIDDTGIVIALSNFIDSIVKESINDTFCTRMYTEGGNLDIRRVNPDGRNYVYYYDTFYDLMSDELVSHLKNYLKAIEDNKIGYQTAFAEWSEAKTKYDEASVIMKATDAEMTRWNDRYFVLDKNGASQEEKDAFFRQWEDWQHSSGRWNAADVMVAQGKIVSDKKVVLDNINSLCNVKNFLTTSDFIELDQFETEGSYKQEAFAYIKGMSEAEKGDIAQILKTYATEEIARCNSPRYTYNVSLSNFCTIEGCEYFAESLDVGKYITLYDDVTGESVKLIVVKIETDKENPKDLKLTFSDKMTGHEKFSTLNEYLNNAIKNMDDIEKTNVRIDEIETTIDSVINKQEVLETSVSTLYENYQATSFNIETYTSPNLQTASKNPIGAINEVFQSTTDAFNLFKNSIISKGGTVIEPVNKSNINNGILSIKGDVVWQGYKNYGNLTDWKWVYDAVWNDTADESVKGKPISIEDWSRYVYIYKNTNEYYAIFFNDFFQKANDFYNTDDKQSTIWWNLYRNVNPRVYKLNVQDRTIISISSATHTKWWGMTSSETMINTNSEELFNFVKQNQMFWTLIDVTSAGFGSNWGWTPDFYTAEQIQWGNWQTLTCAGETIIKDGGVVATGQLTINIVKTLFDKIYGLSGMIRTQEPFIPTFGNRATYNVLEYRRGNSPYMWVAVPCDKYGIVTSTIWQHPEKSDYTNETGNGSQSDEIQSDGKGNYFIRYKELLESIPNCSIIQVEKANYTPIRGSFDLNGTIYCHVARYDYWTYNQNQNFNQNISFSNVPTNTLTAPNCVIQENLIVDGVVYSNAIGTLSNSLTRNNAYKFIKTNKEVVYVLALGSNYGIKL